MRRSAWTVLVVGASCCALWGVAPAVGGDPEPPHTVEGQQAGLHMKMWVEQHGAGLPEKVFLVGSQPDLVVRLWTEGGAKQVDLAPAALCVRVLHGDSSKLRRVSRTTTRATEVVTLDEGAFVERRVPLPLRARGPVEVEAILAGRAAAGTQRVEPGAGGATAWEGILTLTLPIEVRRNPMDLGKSPVSDVPYAWLTWRENRHPLPVRLKLIMDLGVALRDERSVELASKVVELTDVSAERAAAMGVLLRHCSEGWGRASLPLLLATPTDVGGEACQQLLAEAAALALAPSVDWVDLSARVWECYGFRPSDEERAQAKEVLKQHVERGSPAVKHRAEEIRESIPGAK